MRNGLFMLAALGELQASRMKFNNCTHAVLKVVYDAMTLRSTIAVIQRHALCTMFFIAENNIEKKVAIANKGLIDVVIKLLETEANRLDVQELGVRVIRILCPAKTNQDKMGKAGGIEKVLEAMSTCGESLELQAEACWALSNITYNHAENRVLAFQKGAVDALLKSMEANPTSNGVQKHGCRALRNIGHCATENLDQIARPVVIQTICKAMELHPELEPVQEQACLALLDLSRAHPAARTTIESANGPALVQKAVKAHGHNSDLRNTGAMLLKDMSLSELAL